MTEPDRSLARGLARLTSSVIGPRVGTRATLRHVRDKQALRAEMRAVRRAIATDIADRAARSERIWTGIVAAMALAPPARVMLFEGLPTEPDTASWFAWCKAHDVAAFAPAVDGTELRVEPGDVDPALLDVVVVPGLAFTSDGRRLGQGGGHCDRFLPRLRPTCRTVGAAFAEQLLDDLPTEPHDVRLDLVVTDA
jgi:5-formyltetrahydrofolate cyclo-ligase